MAEKKRTLFTFVVLCPIFLLFSLLLSQWWQGRGMDFAVYWLAGHTILAGQNVYDTAQWQAMHEAEHILAYAGRTFTYPLPLAIFLVLPGLLPIQSAYILWMFFAQIAILVTIVILLSFYSARSGYLELLAIGGIFFFRPMFSLINSGQILAFLMPPLAIAIRLFYDRKWFAGGLILSVWSLKPSIGFPILVLTGLWLLCNKQWKGIWGMAFGGLILAFIGALVNYRWVIDYASHAESSFQRYFGVQPTLWGAVDQIFKINRLSLAIGFLCTAAVLAIEIYLFWKNKSEFDSFAAFATIVPAALLIAPYLWNYDQVLLAVPILFLLSNIFVKYGLGKATLFIVGIVALAFAMVVVAYQVGNDVWSVMNSFVVWIFMLYFVTKRNWSLKQETVIANTG